MHGAVDHGQVQTADNSCALILRCNEDGFIRRSIPVGVAVYGQIVQGEVRVGLVGMFARSCHTVDGAVQGLAAALNGEGAARRNGNVFCYILKEGDGVIFCGQRGGQSIIKRGEFLLPNLCHKDALFRLFKGVPRGQGDGGDVRILGGLIGQLNRNLAAIFGLHIGDGHRERAGGGRGGIVLSLPLGTQLNLGPLGEGAVRNHSGGNGGGFYFSVSRRLHICCHVVLAVALVQLDGILLIAARKGTAPDLHRGTLDAAEVPVDSVLQAVLSGVEGAAFNHQRLAVGQIHKRGVCLVSGGIAGKGTVRQGQVQSGGIGARLHIGQGKLSLLKLRSADSQVYVLTVESVALHRLIIGGYRSEGLLLRALSLLCGHGLLWLVAGLRPGVRACFLRLFHSGDGKGLLRVRRKGGRHQRQQHARRQAHRQDAFLHDSVFLLFDVRGRGRRKCVSIPLRRTGGSRRMPFGLHTKQLKTGSAGLRPGETALAGKPPPFGKVYLLKWWKCRKIYVKM